MIENRVPQNFSLKIRVTKFLAILGYKHTIICSIFGARNLRFQEQFAAITAAVGGWICVWPGQMWAMYFEYTLVG